MGPRAAILAFALGAMLAAADDGGRPQVLCLHSYHPAAWSDSLQRGYRAGLGLDGRDDLDLVVEHLDGKRAPEGEYAADWWRLFAIRHRGTRFAAVIAADDIAFRAALQRQDGPLGGTPLVFCGVNDWHPDLIGASRRVTGVVERGDLDHTLAFGLRLRPAARSLHVVCDRSETGESVLAELRRELARLRPGLGLVLLRDLPVEDLGDRLAGIPRGDLAFFIAYWKDPAGAFLSRSALADALRRSAVPVLARAEWQVGGGVMGGYCVSGEDQGRVAGRLARRILDGADPGSLPVETDSPNRWIFDHHELDRFGIEERELPPGSVVRGRPDSAWRGYAGAIAAATAGLAGLAAVLALALRRARRMQRLAGTHRTALHACFDQSRHPLAHLDHHGRILAANRSFMACFSPAGAVAGRPFLELMEASCGTGCAGLPDGLRSAALGQTVRKALTCRCGAITRHFDLSLIPLAADSRGVDGIMVEGREVTEEMLAATALRESDERFRLLAEAIPQAFWIYDWPGLRLRYASPAFAHLFARPLADLQGDALAWMQAVHPEDRPRIEMTLLGAGAMPDEGWHGEFRILHGDGQVRWIEASAKPVRDREGTLVRLAGLASDVTAKREVEERLRAGQRLEAMGQLAGGVAHDFNNQLAAILGYAELMHKRSEGDTRRWSESLLSAAQRSASLTRQLLAFARHSEPVHAPVDMHVLVGEALALARVGMGSGIQISTRLDADHCTVMGDPGLLQNAVLNLCLNARDAMPEGGALAISTRVAEAGEAAGADGEEAVPASLAPGPYLALAVEDSGTGMPPEVLARLFEPFFTTKPLGKGTGLGLTAARGVVRQIGGLVTVRSQVGRGSCFTIWLPLVEAEARMRTSGPMPAGGLQGATVLVADDESGVRSVIVEQLRLLGCTVHEAADADEAVRAYARHRPALALIDMVMPGGGRTAFAGIRAHDPQARVLVVSGYSPDGEVQSLLSAGAAGFLQKPFSGRDLAKVVITALGAARVDSGGAGAQPPSP